MDGGTTPTVIHVHLTRPASSDVPADPASWGFRLFATNAGVGVQAVQRGTLADICGLLVGDDVLRINGQDTAGMTLESAREVITEAGNDVELVVQRGPTRIWQPQVTYSSSPQPVMASTPQPRPQSQGPQPVQGHVLTGAHDTNRSRRQPPAQIVLQPQVPPPPPHHLAHHQPVGNNYRQTQATGHHQNPPAPFTPSAPPPVNYSLAMPPRFDVRQVPMINTPPRPFYLSVQGGATATLDRRPHRHHHHQGPPPAPAMHQSAYEPPMHRSSYPGPVDDELTYVDALGHPQDVDVRSTSTGGGSRGNRQLRAPYAPSNEAEYEEDRRQPAKSGSWVRQGVPVLPPLHPQQQDHRSHPAPPPPPVQPPPPMMPHPHHQRSLSSGRVPRGPAVNAMVGLVGGGVESSSEPPRCMACTGFVTGVFAKIRGRPIHPECFRCTTCGTSLKNRGHFWINDRLYCDVHARQMDSRNVLY